MAVTDEDVQQAEKRMTAQRANGFAVSARYDRRDALVVIELNTGVRVAFPPRLVEGLADASADELAEVEISPAGVGLHWPKLDADVYVPALLQGVVGSKRWMAAELGAVGGKARSSAKAEAARENSRKGGRPRKAAKETAAAEKEKATTKKRPAAKKRAAAKKPRRRKAA
jgi:hypothetical protein